MADPPLRGTYPHTTDTTYHHCTTTPSLVVSYGAVSWYPVEPVIQRSSDPAPLPLHFLLSPLLPLLRSPPYDGALLRPLYRSIQTSPTTPLNNPIDFPLVRINNYNIPLPLLSTYYDCLTIGQFVSNTTIVRPPAVCKTSKYNRPAVHSAVYRQYTPAPPGHFAALERRHAERHRQISRSPANFSLAHCYACQQSVAHCWCNLCSSCCSATAILTDHSHCTTSKLPNFPTRRLPPAFSSILPKRRSNHIFNAIVRLDLCIFESHTYETIVATYQIHCRDIS